MNRRSLLASAGTGTLFWATKAAASVDMRHLSWPFWHEGVPLFNDAPPGAMRDLRDIKVDWRRKQAANGQALAQFEGTPDAELQRQLDEVQDYVGRTFAVAEHLRWTAVHEGLLTEYRKRIARQDYKAIRAAYAAKQPNPNRKNLLAAMSNGWIQGQIESIR